MSAVGRRDEGDVVPPAPQETREVEAVPIGAAGDVGELVHDQHPHRPAFGPENASTICSNRSAQVSVSQAWIRLLPGGTEEQQAGVVREFLHPIAEGAGPAGGTVDR